MKIREYSLIKLRKDYKKYLQKQEKNDNPLLEEDIFIFLGEIPNMKGHCVIAGNKSGKILSGFHLDNFEEIEDGET